MSTSQFSEVVAITDELILNNASGTNPQTIRSANNGQFRYDQIYCCNLDSIVHHVFLTILIGGTRARYGSVTVPAGAGVAGAASVELLVAFQGSPAPGLVVNAGSTVQIGVEETITSPLTVQMIAQGGTL